MRLSLRRHGGVRGDADGTQAAHFAVRRHNRCRLVAALSSNAGLASLGRVCAVGWQRPALSLYLLPGWHYAARRSRTDRSPNRNIYRNVASSTTCMVLPRSAPRRGRHRHSTRRVSVACRFRLWSAVAMDARSQAEPGDRDLEPDPAGLIPPSR
jgi:hypothetical protein